MKKRKFYPRQVAKRLTGKSPESLTFGEGAALRFFKMKGRKMGVGVQIAQTDLADLKSSGPEESAAILDNANSRILMTIR
jgi:hypothetical protein